MNTAVLKDRCRVLEEYRYSTALGEEILEWKVVGDYWTRRIPVDARMRLAYQQKNSIIDCRFVFNSGIDLRLGLHRIIHRGKTYEMVDPPMTLDRQITVMVKEIISGR